MTQEYDYPDWPVFLADGGENMAMRELQTRFEDRLDELRERHSLSTPGDTLQRDAFKGFCSIVGHGTGLWDSDHERDHALEEVIKADGELCATAEQLDEEISAAREEHERARQPEEDYRIAKRAAEGIAGKIGIHPAAMSYGWAERHGGMAWGGFMALGEHDRAAEVSEFLAALRESFGELLASSLRLNGAGGKS